MKFLKNKLKISMKIENLTFLTRITNFQWRLKNITENSES